jgi:hypothetical protein
MGHYCHICGRVRANEKFSGRGHRDHICNDCQRLPHEERALITCMDELYDYLEQSHISQKNIDRLRILLHHSDPEVRSLAELVQDIARVKPYRRRRLKFLAEKHRSLLLRLVEAYEGDLPDKFGPWLLVNADLPQMPNNRGPAGLSFAKEGFQKLQVSPLDL